MVIDMPPTPPTPPAVTAKSGDRSLGEYRFSSADEEFVLRIKGGVRPVPQGELRFGSGAALTLEITSARGKTTLHWDARQCTLEGARQGPCSADDKARAQAALAQMPKPPATPRG